MGTDVSLDAVAKQAGVGIGTLYRNFPTRDALVEAAYRAEVEHLCEAAEELLAAHPPDVALARWMDRFVAYAAAKKGMKGALTQLSAGGSEVFAETRVQIVAAIADAARRGRRGRRAARRRDAPTTSGGRWARSGRPTTPSRSARCCGC